MAGEKVVGGALAVTVARYAVVVPAAFFWLLARNYEGIWHDSLIYSLLAARSIDPAAYARDLFFLYGSQDSFSVFSPAFGALVGWLGLDAAARAVVFVGGALWIGATFALARAMFGDSLAARLAVLCCSVLTLNYSPNWHTFVLNENFATARSIAVPLALFGLAADLGGNSRKALALNGLAIALHPLIGIWTLLLGLAVRLGERWLAVAVVSCVFIVFAGALTSDLRLLQPMSSAWELTVRSSSIDVFVGPLGVMRLNDILFWIASLWFAGRTATPRFRRWYLSAACIAAWAVFVAQLCSYFLAIPLVMQIQPWRVLWLAGLLGVLAWIDWGNRVLRDEPRMLLPVACLVSLLGTSTGYTAALVFALLAASFSAKARSVSVDAVGWLDADRRRMWGAIALFVIVMLPGYWVSLEIAGNGLAIDWMRDWPVFRGLLFAGGAGLTFLLIAWLLGSSVWSLVVLSGFLAALPLAVHHWDTRLPLARQAEARYLAPGAAAHPFRSHIRAGDVVAWPGRQYDVWFVLGVANYASGEQGVGIVFSEEKAFEAKRRIRRLAVAASLTEMHPEQTLAAILGRRAVAGLQEENVHKYEIGAPTPLGLAYLCADPSLDWLIVSTAKPEDYPSGAVARIAGPGGSDLLYRCADVRKTAA